MTDDSPIKLTRGQRAGAHVMLVVMCLPFALPLIWMLATSLKGDAQIYPQGQAGDSLFFLKNMLPNPMEWENYPEALAAVPFGVYLKNTTILCFFNVVGAVFSSAVVAYGFARCQFKGKETLFIIMISTMALPAQVTMIPVFSLYKELGWYGTLLPLIVPMFFGNPFFIFLLRQFFQTVPEEIAEAARIDGAGEWKIFWKIMLPLSRPALATCALFQFMYSWNDFFGPLLYLNDPSQYTLAYGLEQFMSSFGGEWAQLMAAACVVTLPVILLFFLAQRTFIQGISTTGGKS